MRWSFERRARNPLWPGVMEFERQVDVTTPYRLDLTVSVLRRFSTNVVDVVRPDGTYVRALEGGAAPTFVHVRQLGPAELGVRVEGEGDPARAIGVVRRMLGTSRSVPRFDRAAARIAWLRDLARRMRGVKPPRYASLWEACVNAIVFQQISLLAASAILRRTVIALGAPLHVEGIELYAFPSAATLLGTPDDALRAGGLSASKIATLRRVAAALLAGDLDEAQLEHQTTAAAAATLCAIKGVGAWTAALILLRGLGRLDLFPPSDSGVARSAASLAAGGAEVDVPAALALLGDERGMLYYHFLLARLEARGDI